MPMQRPDLASRDRMANMRNEMDFRRDAASAGIQRSGQELSGKLRTEAGGWGGFMSGLKKVADDAKAAGMDFAMNPASSVVNKWAADKQAQQQALEAQQQAEYANQQLAAAQPTFKDMQGQRLGELQQRVAGYETERNQEAAARRQQEAVGRLNQRGPQVEPETVTTHYGPAANARVQQAQRQRSALQGAMTQAPGFAGRW